MSGFFEIGKIVNTQGVKGEVRVMPSTDDPARFELLNAVEVYGDGCNKLLEIERVRYHKAFVLLKFTGVDDMDAARRLRGALIRIPEAQALPLGEDEYYMRDLYGMTVVTETGETLGELTDIIETGANDVYAIRRPPGQKPAELLIPAIKSCVLSVDTRRKIMTVALPEGLME